MNLSKKNMINWGRNTMEKYKFWKDNKNKAQD